MNSTVETGGNNDGDDVAKQSENANGSINKRKRRRFAEPSEWKRNKMQKLRECGKRYIGQSKKKESGKQTKVTKEERKLGPRCKSVACKNSKKRFCDDIPEERRKEIFSHFWDVLNWYERKPYIASLVECRQPKQKRRQESGDRRGCSLHYFIKINNEKKEVCRDMFCNTFDLGVWSVRTWAKNVTHGMVNTSESKRKNPAKERGAIQKSSRNDFASEFINSLPKVPSHYCRKDTSKLYLENSFHSLMDVYRLYKEKCRDAENTPLSRFAFNQILCKMNVALFQPRKDQCDVCCQFKVGNLSQTIYDCHIIAKDRARKEKEIDKQEANENKLVALVVDVEAVKLCPFLKASAFYFKTKLAVHNYTVYNLKTAEVDCYWWNEAEGDLDGTNFVSLLVSHLENLIKNWNPVCPKVIVVWSDGCGYQNKNKFLSNALLNLAVRNKFTIHQKYLVVGHTQMEVDSVHAAIENRLVNREIYLPSEYVSATKEARSKPFPYRAKLITHDFFKDFTIKSGEYYNSIRPGRKVGDPTVNDVCHYQYLPSGEIMYKLNFDDSFKSLPIRPKGVREDVVYPQRYLSQLSIPDSKWVHLQQLKSLIPQDVHYFYDNLPH